jgi:hypothetical protein
LSAFDPEASLWIKLKQGSAENGMIRAHPAEEPQSPQANVSIPSLVRELYNAAVRVSFSPVEYSVVYENGGLVPASLCLIREDQQGRFWITCKKLSELKEIRWFVAINGVMTGMKLDERDLIFHSKPVPSLAAIAAERLSYGR